MTALVEEWTRWVLRRLSAHPDAVNGPIIRHALEQVAAAERAKCRAEMLVLREGLSQLVGEMHDFAPTEVVAIEKRNHP